jgi:F420-dependent oxidoreductase-like protein
MKIGLQVPNFTWPGSTENLGATFGRIARDAEQAGFDSFWVMDHFFQISFVGPPENEMLEGYTALAFAAGQTERIKLGTLVTGVTYRYPGILIKTVTTLDVLSGGRAYLGIGAAWNEEEHQGLGVPFPSMKERFERLEETLQVAHQMWGGDEQPFEGRHYRLQRPMNSPQSLSKPRPPIMIGGTGEQKTLRFVAKYGDACNLFARLGKDVLKQKLDVLCGHCDAEGRPYSEIEKTTLDHTLPLSRDGANGTQTPTQMLEAAHTQAELGIDHLIISLSNVHEAGVFDLFATDVIPELHNIVPAGRSQ